jgi:hypothetical protein
MSNDYGHWLMFQDTDDYQRLRDVLFGANYTVPGILDVMGQKDGSVSTTDAPLVLQRTESGRPIDTLMRLFLAKAPVTEAAARRPLRPGF